MIPRVQTPIKIGVSRGPFVFKNFINRGAGNTELMSNFRCTSALLMKRQHDVPVHGTPAAKFDSFQLCFLSALIRALGSSGVQLVPQPTGW